MQLMEPNLKTIIDPWVTTILADPINKQHVSINNFPLINNIIDARIFLKNTPGYSKWMSCQDKYVNLMLNDKSTKAYYANEIEYDKPIYDHFKLKGRILDVGGGCRFCARVFSEGC
jgi:hypothetical protein